MASSKIKHFKGFSIVDGDIRVTLNMSRFERQFQRAQYQLDGAVMNSMVPYMPMITGAFINKTRADSAAMQGTGLVEAAAHHKDDSYMKARQWWMKRPEAHGPEKEPKRC